MLRNIFSFGGMLLLAGAAFIATPGSSWAQHHGGGHVGGGHVGGGGHFVGARPGGYNGGIHGGYHYGYPHDYRHSYGSYGSSYPYFGSYGYSYPYFGSYGYAYPSYGSYGYGYPSYDPYAYYASPSPSYNSAYYYGSSGDVTPSYANAAQADSQPATAQSGNTAQVTVSAPADATIWFNGTKMSSAGSVRQYASPSLTPGNQYTYEVQARWNENGHEVTQTQRVHVSAGAHVNVNFPVAPMPTGQASAVKKS
jgi:uncharacterized protein (TIGR03000 family)